MPANTSPTNAAEQNARIRREMIQLAVLVVVAAAAFFLTKALAASNRELKVRNAAEWYARGEQDVRADRIDEAIDAFRRATVRSREDTTYVLALARALVLKRDYDAARGLLLRVRESAPEDTQISLDLARVAVARHDVTEALRFYRAALYAPWPVEQADQRRRVRLELVRFLLANGQQSRGEAELLAASTDIQDDGVHHVELADLFAQAGDDRHALDHFQRALRLEPEAPEVLAGAGQAAFRLGQYPLAQRYFHRIQDRPELAADTREIVDLLLSRDPMAARIGSHERRLRLTNDLSYVEQRFNDCFAKGGAIAQDPALKSELDARDADLRATAPLDQDTLESSLDLIARVEGTVSARCGPASAMDQALLLIARQHGVATK